MGQATAALLITHYVVMTMSQAKITYPAHPENTLDTKQFRKMLKNKGVSVSDDVFRSLTSMEKVPASRTRVFIPHNPSGHGALPVW